MTDPIEMKRPDITPEEARRRFDKRRREKYWRGERHRRQRATLALVRFPCECHTACNEDYFRVHMDGGEAGMHG